MMAQGRTKEQHVHVLGKRIITESIPFSLWLQVRCPQVCKSQSAVEPQSRIGETDRITNNQELQSTHRVPSDRAGRGGMIRSCPTVHDTQPAERDNLLPFACVKSLIPRCLRCRDISSTPTRELIGYTYCTHHCAEYRSRPSLLRENFGGKIFIPPHPVVCNG